MKPRGRGTQGKIEPLNLSKARQLLSPLVRRVTGAPETAVPISVHGQVCAYLISAEHFEYLVAREQEAVYHATPERPRLRGSVQVLGDLEQASTQASAELEAMALRRAGRIQGKGPATGKPSSRRSHH